jgi:hypothetical protein
MHAMVLKTHGAQLQSVRRPDPVPGRGAMLLENAQRRGP